MPDIEASSILAAVLDPNANPPTDFKDLVCDADSFLKHLKIPALDNLQFVFDGVLFRVSHKKQDAGNGVLTVWAVLGYMPYSVVSKQKRKILIDILSSLRDLPLVKLGLDDSNRVIALGTFKTQSQNPIDYFFDPLLRFLQEAMPYIRLIGEAL